MTAALELRDAGYAVQVLEFNNRPGGRNWTLRGGDRFEELGGFAQTVRVSRTGSISIPGLGGSPIIIVQSSITASD